MEPAETATKPAANKKLIVILVAVALVVIAIAAVIFLTPETTTLGEIGDFQRLYQTTYITLYQGEKHFIEEVCTTDGTPIWEAIRDIEFQVVDAQTHWEMEREILSSEYIESHAYCVDSIYIMVSRSGLVCIKYYPNEGDLQYICGRKGEALFEALHSFVPTEGHIAIADVLPDLEWEEIVLYVTADGTSSGQIYFDTPQEINIILEGLKTMVFPYGGAEYDYKAPLNCSLELHPADWMDMAEFVNADCYYISFNQNGDGRVWMGNWSYSVTGCEQLMIFLGEYLS